VKSLVAALLLAAGTEPVVSVSAPGPVRLAPGGRSEARIAVRVKEGFHVQANPASAKYLIPLRLTLTEGAGVKPGEPVYPPGVPYRLQGADSDLSTYEGSFDLRLPLEAAKDAPPGRRELRGELRYQACDARICLRPASVPVTVPVEVARP
jgi:hypothetical protein